MGTKNKYQSPEWKAYRDKVFELDQHRCVRCNRHASKTTVLQAHHKVYLKDILIWEHPYDLCETLCKRCHATEHGKVPPNKGWEFIRKEDLGDLKHYCEYCGKHIRHTFYIQHPRWEPLVVGVVCCNKLTETDAASKIQLKERRLKTFICSKRWEYNKGTHTITQDDFKILIFPRHKGFQIQINSTDGNITFLTLEYAKEHVFEAIYNGDIKRYFEAKQNQEATHLPPLSS